MYVCSSLIGFKGKMTLLGDKSKFNLNIVYFFFSFKSGELFTHQKCMQKQRGVLGFSLKTD